MQPMALGQQQLLPGQPPQMMPSQQQFVQTLGQVPQGANPQQMQQYLQQSQLLSSMQQQVKQPMQQPMQMQNLGLPQGIQQGNAPAWPMQQNQGLTQTPIDILSIADKAAQALSGGTFPQGNTPAAMANPNFPPQTVPAPVSSFQQTSMVTEKELPLMVQYAIQNLRTTGHIEQTLDGSIVQMLKRLPEHAALQALEIFSSCETSKMRNKQAYLAGILKKELAKNGL